MYIQKSWPVVATMSASANEAAADVAHMVPLIEPALHKFIRRATCRGHDLDISLYEATLQDSKNMLLMF